MKHNFFAICGAVVAVACAGAVPVTGANPPYVLAANSEGELVKSGDDYPSKVPMVEVSDLIYEAKGVEIKNGFVFLGESSASDEVYSLYSIPKWAANPAIVSMYNPVSISSVSGPLIGVAPGRYDVTFVARSKTGTGYHMFKLEPSDDGTAVGYPEAMYMVSSPSEYIRVPGGDGVYEADVTLPSSFRVSYEPCYDVGTFVYGPATASDNLLTNGVALPLVYNDNTTVNIGYAPVSGSSDGLASGKNCRVTIDIRKGSESVKALVSGTSAVEGVTGDGGVSVSVSGGTILVEGAAGCVKNLYTLSGMPVFQGTADVIGTLPAGFYLLRVGDNVCKVAVR